MIKEQYGSESKYIEPGEHKVEIIKIENGKSKKTEKPMLTVTFENSKKQTTRGFYIQGVTFSMKKLADLKAACGLNPLEGADKLMGKRCGILVKNQKPNENGITFTEIAGYALESDADESKNNAPVVTAPIPQEDNSLPF